MTCRTIWNITSDESFHSDVSSEIDFMQSTKESENKDAEYIICNGKFSEDERGDILYFSCSIVLQQRTLSISVTFIN